MKHIVVDTDAWIDDLLAIAFLLARVDVDIEAITIVNGVAHVEAAAANVAGVLQLADRTDIPVYQGDEEPLPGGTPFPAAWRRVADALPSVSLPADARHAQPLSAADYLSRRFVSGSEPVTILALGPHTNLGSALNRTASGWNAIEEIFMLAGAFFVPGNVDRDGGAAAEWNLFADPIAAQAVFTSGLVLRDVPLDATNQVPIDTGFLAELRGIDSPLGTLAYQVLRIHEDLIRAGGYFAWDPLAAVGLVQRSVLRTKPLQVALTTEPPEAGRTKEDATSPFTVDVALQADASAFREAYLGALRR